jgi:hypothetical protein
MKSLSWALLIVALPIFSLYVVMAFMALSSEPILHISDIEIPKTIYYLSLFRLYGAGLLGWLALFILFYLVKWKDNKSIPKIIYVGLFLGFYCCFSGKIFMIFSIPVMLLVLVLLLENSRKSVIINPS